MLTRLYVDNFRCLVNFELKFNRMNLLLGENGATHYSVSYQIKNTAGKLQFEFQEPEEFTSTERDVKQFGTLDLNKVPPGDYLLTIKVSDRVGQHDRTTVAMFKKSG